MRSVLTEPTETEASESEDKALPIDIKNPSRYMTLTYIISLAIIALMSLAVHVMLDRIISEQTSTGEIINRSGQQRMLSQRASLFTLEYLATGSEVARDTALKATERMAQNHRFLLSGHRIAEKNGLSSPLSEELQALYFSEPTQVDNTLMTFLDIIDDALNSTRPQNVSLSGDFDSQFMSLATTILLDGLNDVVDQYEQESVEKVNGLRQAQNLVLGIIILTIVFEAMFIFRPMVRRVSEFASKLRHDANYDELTNVYNRRAFKLLSNKTIAQHRRYGQPMSVLMIDIDRFKGINDTFGHSIGDIVIQATSRHLVTLCRESDIITRFGGEEFVVLLPQTDLQGAIKTAEKVRLGIANMEVLTEDEPVKFTVSIGISELSANDQSIEPTLSRADQALYRAKRSGRDRVETE